MDCKVVLLGREFAGKTSILERCLHDRWIGDSLVYQSTIGAAFGSKPFDVDRETVILGVWDTAGSERYEAMSRIYYRGAFAAIVCYDLTNKQSFERVRFWVSELQKYEENCHIFLCGTKYDLVEDHQSKRQVDYYSVTDYADELGDNIKVYETSSKTGHRVMEMFRDVAVDYVVNRNKNIVTDGTQIDQLRDENVKNNSTVSTDTSKRCIC